VQFKKSCYLKFLLNFLFSEKQLIVFYFISSITL
jgi:hypothetical protein